MNRHLRQLTALFLGFGLLMMASGLVNSLLVLRMGSEGFALASTGLVMSAHAVGFLVGPFVIPKLIHRVGHIRLFAILAAVAAAATLAHPLLIHPLAWLLFRAATGFALAGCAMILESWLNHRTPSEMRGGILGSYMMVNYLGFGGGQFLLLAGEPSGFELFSIAAILFTVALLPVAATRIGEPERPAPHLPPLRRLWRLSPLGTVGCFAAGFIGTAFIAAGPLFARARGLDTPDIAVFMGMGVMAGLALQIPIGRLSDRVDRRRMIAAVAFAVVGAAAVMMIVTRFGAGPAIGAVILYGGIAYVLYPLSVAHANDVVAPGEAVTVSAGLIFASGTGATLGPIVATNAMSVIGADGLFVVIGLAAGSLGSFAVWRALEAAPVPEAERSGFMPMAPATPAAVDLDPRAVPQPEVTIIPPGENP
jgi:MFS family permease